MTLYDVVPYDSVPCEGSHPGSLSAIARLLGLSPSPLERCRVLELGCGTGANLLPMAAALPGAAFVGVDLSAAQIAAARAEAGAAGLGNVTLLAEDFSRLDAELGRFDFVIAHGVYSWVPAPVQDALLRVARECLAEDGVAFVSYTALPGAHPRLAVREMLGWHVRGEPDPRKRVEAARELAALAAASMPNGAPNAIAVRKLLAEVGGMSDAYLLHDYLSDVHEAVTLDAFASRARAHGLQYLADAQFHRMFPRELDPSVSDPVRAWARDQVSFEQYFDFLGQRAFRSSLLCRAERALDRRLSWDRLEGLWLSTLATPRGREDGHWLFRSPGGEVFGSDSPLVAAALRILVERRPRPVVFADLCDEARKAVDARPATEEDRAALGTDLVAAFASGEILLSAGDRRIRRTAEGDAPLTALASARVQAARGPVATDLWHRAVGLDPDLRAALPLLDGRSRAALQVEADKLRPGAGALWLESQLAKAAEGAFLLEGA